MGAWPGFFQQLNEENRVRPIQFLSQDTSQRYDQFVRELPANALIPLLLEAYESYRTYGALSGFASSAHSVLISSILKQKLSPNTDQACAILKASYHYCGHGCDVSPPLDLAEQAFAGQPYSEDMFAAVRAYREVLRPLTSIQAKEVARKLDWVLWHDPKHPAKGCWTMTMQESLATMDSREFSAWQMLLRNTAAGLNAAPGKEWIKRGTARMNDLGADTFLARLDQWLTFPQDDKVRLLAPGSNVLRLLVWYGALVNVNQSLAILERLAFVNWHKPEPAQKIASALAWFIRTHGGGLHRAAAEQLCRLYASESSEVARLEEEYWPERVQANRPAILQIAGSL